MRDQNNEIKRIERQQREEKGRQEQQESEQKSLHDRDLVDHNERGARYLVHKIQKFYHWVRESMEQYELLMKGVEVVAGVLETLIKCHRMVSEVTEKVCHKIPMVGGIIQGVGLLLMVTLRAVGLRQSQSVPFHKKLSLGVKTFAGIGMIAVAIVGIAIPPLGALMGAVIVGISFGLSLYKFARTAYKLHHAQLRHQLQDQQVSAENSTSSLSEAPTLSRQLIHQQSKMKKRQYHVALGAITLGIAIALVSATGVGAVILVGCAIGMNAAYLGKSLGLFSRVKRWFGRSLRRSRRQTRAQQGDMPMVSPVAHSQVNSEEPSVLESPVARSVDNERKLTNSEAKRSVPEQVLSEPEKNSVSIQGQDNNDQQQQFLRDELSVLSEAHHEERTFNDVHPEPQPEPAEEKVCAESPIIDNAVDKQVDGEALTENKSAELSSVPLQEEEDSEGGQQDEDDETDGGVGEINAAHLKGGADETLREAPEKNTVSEPHPEPMHSSHPCQESSSETKTKAQWTDLAHVDEQQRRQQAIMRDELLALHQASVHGESKSFHDVHPEHQALSESDENTEVTSEQNGTGSNNSQDQTEKGDAPVKSDSTLTQSDEEDDDGEGESRHDDEDTDRQERLHP